MIERHLLLATTNAGKIREIRQLLQDLGIQVFSPQELNLDISIPEKGGSFLENARAKSIAASEKTDFLSLAEDSGLEVEYLRGEPGVYSARFSGSAATDEKNIQKLLSLLEGVPFRKRKARFVSCVVLSQRGKIIKEITASVRGYIAFEKKGSYGFGYDPIFYYPPLKKTFAELPPEEKNRISHRGRALRKMKAFLRRGRL